MSHLKSKWRSLFQSGHERVTVSAEVSSLFSFLNIRLEQLQRNSSPFLFLQSYLCWCLYLFNFFFLVPSRSLFGSNRVIASIDPFRPHRRIFFFIHSPPPPLLFESQFFFFKEIPITPPLFFLARWCPSVGKCLFSAFINVCVLVVQLFPSVFLSIWLASELTCLAL